MKLRMIFLMMDTLTLLSLPILYVYDKLRRFGRPVEDDQLVKTVPVRSNNLSRR